MGNGRQLIERYPHLPHATREGYQIVLTTNQHSSPATDKYLEKGVDPSVSLSCCTVTGKEEPACASTKSVYQIARPDGAKAAKD